MKAKTKIKTEITPIEGITPISVSGQARRDNFLLHMYEYLDMLQQLFRKFESCERRGYMNLRGFMKLLKFIGLFADVEH